MWLHITFLALLILAVVGMVYTEYREAKKDKEMYDDIFEI